MPYYNIECENEKIDRMLLVTDIKKDNPIFELVIKQVKEDISNRLIQREGSTAEMITDAMEKYRPRIVVQTIYCSSCKYLRVDVGPNAQTKTKEDLWRSYEVDRFVKQFMEGR